MMISEAVLDSGSLAQLDADGIRLRQDSGSGRINDVEFFLTYRDLMDLNALVGAMGRSVHYNQLVERYAGPFSEPLEVLS
jgi:hypothetical protein